MNKLSSADVTLDEVITTTGNAVRVSPLSYLEASTPGTGGFLETGHQRLGVQRVLPITTPQELDQVSLEGAAGPPQGRTSPEPGPQRIRPGLAPGGGKGPAGFRGRFGHCPRRTCPCAPAAHRPSDSARPADKTLVAQKRNRAQT